jgi:hypothetical protein
MKFEIAFKIITSELDNSLNFVVDEVKFNPFLSGKVAMHAYYMKVEHSKPQKIVTKTFLISNIEDCIRAYKSKYENDSGGGVGAPSIHVLNFTELDVISLKIVADIAGKIEENLGNKPLLKNKESWDNFLNVIRRGVDELVENLTLSSDSKIHSVGKNVESDVKPDREMGQSRKICEELKEEQSQLNKPK